MLLDVRMFRDWTGKQDRKMLSEKMICLQWKCRVRLNITNINRRNRQWNPVLHDKNENVKSKWSANTFITHAPGLTVMHSSAHVSPKESVSLHNVVPLQDDLRDEKRSFLAEWFRTEVKRVFACWYCYRSALCWPDSGFVLLTDTHETHTDHIDRQKLHDPDSGGAFHSSIQTWV